ncbi:MAG: FAD-binding protein [Acidimicrobiia bacterium]
MTLRTIWRSVHTEGLRATVRTPQRRRGPQAMRIAVCVKQIPAFEAMELGANGRIAREGVPLEMNAYCRRAVATAATLAAEHHGHVTVVTMGPPAAIDALREAIAWCDNQHAPAHGVLLSDDALRGSDTLATARALHAVLDRLGPFDLVLLGRNSLDADTGQVGPELAELLGVPMLSGVRSYTMHRSPETNSDACDAICEYDDSSVTANATLPLLMTCAERLCEPAKVDPDDRLRVDASRITTLRAADLGPGPWGAAGSPTWVGETRTLATTRRCHVDPTASLDTQVVRALAILTELGALDPSGAQRDHPLLPPPVDPARATKCIAVICEPGHATFAREVLGEAAHLAARVDGYVAGFAARDDAGPLASWGADTVHAWSGLPVAEDCAHAIAQWCAMHTPWAVLAPSTVWGREVAGRIAARLGVGLTGDAVELDVVDDRLVAGKPAFGGLLVAAIHSTSAIQMATVRAGVFDKRAPRASAITAAPLDIPSQSRVGVTAIEPTDDLNVLADASVVLGVGGAVPPDAYADLESLRIALGAELAASRKVTDQGWLARSRQLGITGRAIAPRLYVAIGISGKYNHMVGVRAARAVLAINPDANAPVFGFADAGIVAPWQAAVPALVTALAARVAGASSCTRGWRK